MNSYKTQDEFLARGGTLDQFKQYMANNLEKHMDNLTAEEIAHLILEYGL
jgi:hypothetical protein